ncbi:hypothetical protein DVP09_00290 [Yersinia enterocolitica]|nr:hypothetical protein [Yersinia enterocolitica]EKN5020013.1 hypothetical protein [Yersinia enterocolitica]EKN5049443.1 hypothetical protein [Yersinia enterocolitica]EKN5069395.1 hypothetical protein [Yersinia enterocolitica]EKN5091442.1 hypothetical protein [Yersinia enterocolitica]
MDNINERGNLARILPVIRIYTRYTSSCMCVGYVQLPESLTRVSSSGFSLLPPSCDSNYLEYIRGKRI